MKLFFKLPAVICLALLLGAQDTALAELLFEEKFEYPDGELQSATRGMWLRHSGEIDGQFVVNNTLFIDDDGTKDYSRALGDFPPIREGAVYAAFDLNVSTIDPPENSSSTAPYFMHFAEEFGGGTAQIVSRLVMNPGTAPGTFRLGIVRGGGSNSSTTPWGANLANGVRHRVVVAYDLDAEVSTLWVNPTSTASGSVTNATGIGLPIIGLNWLAFRIDGTSGRSGDKTIDNLIVATTLAEVLSVASTPPLTPGDFDGDGDVDGADFVAWQSNFPAASGATLSQGDADGDGDVDGADFVAWQTSFSNPSTPGAISTPEPPGIGLCGVALCITLHRARGRCYHGRLLPSS